MGSRAPSIAGLDLAGFSLGGIETCVRVPPWKLAIDVGRGRRDAIRCDHIALTHTHMDHAGGLPYVLALRMLFHMAPPRVYVPAQMAEGVRAVVAAWDAVQRYDTAWELVPVEPGESYPLSRDRELVPFRTYHPVPSCGYTVVRTTRRLRAEHRGRPGPEIAKLRKKGVEVTEAVREPLLSVTGDTLPEVLDKQPQIQDSRVLLMECTFLDDQKPYEACRAGGHVHLRDLIERVDSLRVEHLVLSHFSQIHRWEDVPKLLAPLARRFSGTLWALPTAPGQALAGPIGA